jgi:hypothetical protein
MTSVRRTTDREIGTWLSERTRPRVSTTLASK